MQFVQKYSKKNNSLDKNLLIGFSLLIIVGGVLNTLSNKTLIQVSKEKDKRKKKRLNPVAKNASKFNRAAVFKDKTKYDRKNINRDEG